MRRILPEQPDAALIGHDLQFVIAQARIGREIEPIDLDDRTFVDLFFHHMQSRAEPRRPIVKRETGGPTAGIGRRAGVEVVGRARQRIEIRRRHDDAGEERNQPRVLDPGPERRMQPFVVENRLDVPRQQPKSGAAAANQ